MHPHPLEIIARELCRLSEFEDIDAELPRMMDYAMAIQAKLAAHDYEIIHMPMGWTLVAAVEESDGIED
jgi:phosphatidylserine decarboxylase